MSYLKTLPNWQLVKTYRERMALENFLFIADLGIAIAAQKELESRGINLGYLDAVETDVKASFTAKEMLEFKDFAQFWNDIDTQNAYEEEWNNALYESPLIGRDFFKPYFEIIWDMFMNGQLKLD